MAPEYSSKRDDYTEGNRSLESSFKKCNFYAKLTKLRFRKERF